MVLYDLVYHFMHNTRRPVLSLYSVLREEGQGIVSNCPKCGQIYMGCQDGSRENGHDLQTT